MQVLYCKAGGAMDGAQNVIFMMRMEYKLNPMRVKTWAYLYVSGLLESRVGLNQVNLGTSASIRDRLFW